MEQLYWCPPPVSSFVYEKYFCYLDIDKYATLKNRANGFPVVNADEVGHR